MKNFNDTKKIFKTAVQDIIKTHNSYEINEAALPAYAHKNPLIDYIFWKRVKVAYNYTTKTKSKNILDFGCGTGLLSYALSKEVKSILAIDLNMEPLKLIKEKIKFPDNILFVETDLLQYDTHENKFDVIIALDVLEHIENLEEYITRFKKLLNPNGVVLVSGPSENILYKIGRKLAGKKFTGEYHVSNIKTIKKEFSKHMKTKTLKKLIWPFTLFEIFIAQNN